MGKIHNFDKIPWKPFKKRLGNMEVRNFYINDEGIPVPAQSHLTDNFNFFEVIKFQKNPYYGKESEYEWKDENLAYGKYPNTFINKSCFKNPETNFMIAKWTNLNNDECVPDLQFVGNRPFELYDSEFDEFWNCVKIGQEHIQEVLHSFENEKI
jgi:hypothetical protein